MGNVSREMEILRKNLKMLEIRNTVIEMENAFDWVHQQTRDKQRISDLEYMILETSKVKNSTEKILKEIEQNIQKLQCNNKGGTYT